MYGYFTLAVAAGEEADVPTSSELWDVEPEVEGRFEELEGRGDLLADVDSERRFKWTGETEGILEMRYGFCIHFGGSLILETGGFLVLFVGFYPESSFSSQPGSDCSDLRG